MDIFELITNNDDMDIEDKYAFIKMYLISQLPKQQIVDKIKEIIKQQPYFYFKSARLEIIALERPTFILTMNDKELYKLNDTLHYMNDTKKGDKNSQSYSSNDVSFLSKFMREEIISPFTSYLSSLLNYNEVINIASKYNLDVISEEEYNKLPVYIQTLFGMTFDLNDSTAILEIMF